MAKTIFKLSFEIETALHIGTGNLTPEVGVAEIIQNGAGEYYIPGSTFAGLFFDRLRRLQGKGKVYSALMGIEENAVSKSNKKSQPQASHASPLIFRSAVITDARLMVRDHVKINRKLKAAADGAKFAHWQISPHRGKEALTIETICELDLHSYLADDLKPSKSTIKNTVSVDEMSSAIQAVFFSWQHEGLFIGAFASSGMGWAKLKTVCENGEILEPVTIPSDVFKSWEVTLEIGDEAEGYGTNGLLIKAGDGQLSFHYQDTYSDLDPMLDAVFLHDEKQLFIPGSSLKGAISFYIDKYHKDKGWLESILGQDGANAGKLYFKDLFPDVYTSEHLVTIERHAEDEFTRAILGKGKFDEERLFRTTFKGEIRAYKSDPKINEIEDMIAFINNLLIRRVFTIGAQACCPKVTIRKLR